jgi:hypothetical protein
MQGQHPTRRTTLRQVEILFVTGKAVQQHSRRMRTGCVHSPHPPGRPANQHSQQQNIERFHCVLSL